MHAIKVNYGDLPDNIPVPSSEEAFDKTTQQDEIDSDATTQVMAILGDMDETVVLPCMIMQLPKSESSQASSAPNSSLPCGVAELVKMIRDELQENSIVMSLLLERIATSALAGDRCPFEDYRWQVQRLANASESLGLNGLHHFLSRIVEATCLLESASLRDVMRACQSLGHWPVLVMDYLNHAGQPQQSQALCQYLSSSGFFLPLEVDKTDEMLAALQSPQWHVVASQITERSIMATDEMLLLQVTEDLDHELTDNLLQELLTQTRELSTAIQHIADTRDVNDIRFAQRMAHSLKGTANVAGVRGIAGIAHCFEDILMIAVDDGISPSLSTLMQNAAACLKSMSESLLGVGAAPASAVNLLQSMFNFINQRDNNSQRIARH